MIYYLKQGQSSIFPKVKVIENKCEVTKLGTNKKKIEKTVKKIKKKNIEQIVLSKELKQNEELIKTLKNYDITILDGKWLMQFMTEDIIDYLKQNGKVENTDEIAILINDLTDMARENIKNFASKYKKIRIITNHAERFKNFEKELYERNGISIIISNNKRKAISKSKLIINFDFVEETINQYNINENAIIINLANNITINKKRFSGLIINDYEVEYKNKESDIEENEYSLKEILEERTYSAYVKMPNYNLFSAILDIIKRYDINIKELYGKNGIIK